MFSNLAFAIGEGDCLHVTGPNGCGKTTTGLAVLRLIEPTAGTIHFGEAEITALNKSRLRALKKEIQMIFQDPYSSLNPRMTVNQILRDPMEIHGMYPGAERKERIAYLLEKVGLRPEQGRRYPHEFSGGQRQRIGIARALALNPQVIIGDEPVSALDVSIQAQVINLLEDLQEQFGLTYLFIAHDLAVVEHISDYVAVMYLGRISEVADRDRLYEAPAHPYTQSLLSAVPVADPRRERSRKRIILQGDVPSPANPPSGCRFRTRCPIAQDRCAEETPELREPLLTASDHFPVSVEIDL